MYQSYVLKLPCNYMQFVDWQNSWEKIQKKSEKIQKRWPRLVLDDYESDHGNLIRKDGTTAIEIKRLRIFSLLIQTQKYNYMIS